MTLSFFENDITFYTPSTPIVVVVVVVVVVSIISYTLNRLLKYYHNHFESLFRKSIKTH